MPLHALRAVLRTAAKQLVPLIIILMAVALVHAGGADGKILEVKPKDHISIIGGTLADRMQHDGWLETFFYSRFPTYDLVFRNLGFAADGIKESLRLRSNNFGTPDQ